MNYVAVLIGLVPGAARGVSKRWPHFAEAARLVAKERPGARFVVGVQWHPEHMWRTRPHSKRLFRGFVEACRE